VPLLVATVSTLLGYSMIGITPLPFSALLAIAAVGALSAPLLALVLATAAPNKVAGLAVVKVLNGLNLLPVAAFFQPTPLQYVASSRRTGRSARSGQPLRVRAIWHTSSSA